MKSKIFFPEEKAAIIEEERARGSNFLKRLKDRGVTEEEFMVYALENIKYLPANGSLIKAILSLRYSGGIEPEIKKEISELGKGDFDSLRKEFTKNKRGMPLCFQRDIEKLILTRGR